jgi:hypothetical protein
MGENFWPYGIEANRKTLEALFQYSYEQGLAKNRLTIEDLFHPATLRYFAIWMRWPLLQSLKAEIEASLHSPHSTSGET